jgi:GNAT superfamily N-acetyltransferase
MPSIGSFSLTDLPALRSLLAEYLLEFDPRADPLTYWDEEYIEALLAGWQDGSLTIWLARNGADPVAFAIARIERQWYRRARRAGIFEECYVAPPYRRQGLGRMLVDRALDWFDAQDVAEVRAPVVGRNLAGLLFWQRLGFTIEVYQLYRLSP